MRQIIVIADIIKTNNGKVVVAGANHALDGLTDQQIKQMIGRNVSISGHRYKVGGIETSSSVVGGKNIFIQLADEIQDLSVIKGQKLYA